MATKIVRIKLSSVLTDTAHAPAAEANLQQRADMFNRAIMNLAQEAKEVAASRTFGSGKKGYAGVAAGWQEPTFVTTKIGKLKVYSGITIKNTYRKPKAELLWSLMESGRNKRTWVTARKISANKVTPFPLFANRFRTGDPHMFRKGFRLGKIEATEPLTYTTKFLKEALAEFIKQIRKANFGFFSKEPQQFVRALTDIYKTKRGKAIYVSNKTLKGITKGEFAFTDFTANGLATKAKFGEFGDIKGTSHRQDKKYKFAQQTPTYNKRVKRSKGINKKWR